VVLCPTYVVEYTFQICKNNGMAKRFAVILAFCSMLVACCGAIPVVPQITNEMGWTRGTRITFHADVDFAESERTAIAAACLNWGSFTNGGIRCEVAFDRNFLDKPYTGAADDYAIIRTDGKDLAELISMVDDDEVNPRGILGYAPHSWNLITGDRTAVIFLAMDNIFRGPGDSAYGQYRALNIVTKHEMGHVFGFLHVDEDHQRPNVMHGQLSPTDLLTGRAGGFGDDDFCQCIRLGLCR